MVRPTRLILGILLATGGTLAGCVDADRPGTCAADAVTLEVTVAADGMEPNPAEICTGQDVTLSLRPEVDGVFHIHGLDAHVPATTIVDGEPLDLTFRPDRSGQFPVELHPADDPRGIAIGIITIYER
jgi:hypothetical protein